MHYLIRRLKELPTAERRKVAVELLIEAGKTTATADYTRVRLLSDYAEAAKERVQHFGKMQGISSGYPSIDRLTKGFVDGELTVIAGKTSYGKTTLAVNIANRVALAGHRVLFVTLEMTHVELTSRFMFINGGETEDFAIVGANILLQENDELDWKSIDGLIANAKRQLNVDLVVIDHLHYFTRELENVSEDLGRITKEIKKNAQRHVVPVVLISHVRKTHHNGPATMDDLRASSYIAQDSDVVLMVGKNQDTNEMHIKVEKNRNRGFDGRHDTVVLTMDQIKLVEKPLPFRDDLQHWQQ